MRERPPVSDGPTPYEQIVRYQSSSGKMHCAHYEKKWRIISVRYLCEFQEELLEAEENSGYKLREMWS